MFDMTMYTVPENDRTVPLCIDIGVEITAPITYTITTAQKSPPQAEGKKNPSYDPINISTEKYFPVHASLTQIHSHFRHL